MGLFNFLTRLFSDAPPAPPAWYVETLNHVSTMLGHTIIWGKEDPNTCILAVEVDGRIYYPGTYLNKASIVLVGVPSKVKPQTPGIGPEMSRRNRESLYGTWIVQDNLLLFKADMLAHDFTPERVARAIQTMMPEVLAFDREWLGPRKPAQVAAPQ